MRSTPTRVALTMVVFLVSALPAAGQPPSSWTREWPQTDFSRHSVPYDEIISGGPPRDGIPSIDAPEFEPVIEARDRIEPQEPVMSVKIAGDARAYPLSIMIWHEIVNDSVGGVPVAVTFCPLCNTGIVFRRVVAGEPTTFGTTGRLRHSDLVMYDRATESWWQQYGGEAIVGRMTGAELDTVPARLESFADFAARHPEGRVLLPPAGSMRPYGRNPYAGYDSSAAPFLYRGDYDGPGSPLMRVVHVEGRDEAWSLDLLRREGAIEAGNLVLRWRPGQSSALDADRIAEERDIGSVSVERQLPGGGTEDAVHSIPFAFAFRAFNPEAPIHHTD